MKQFKQTRSWVISVTPMIYYYHQMEMTVVNLVTEAEMNAGDLSRHTYTQHDKMVLHQFEGAAWPAKNLSLFLQDKRNTWTYVLFSLRTTIKEQPLTLSQWLMPFHILI
jgi:hypothetical protein